MAQKKSITSKNAGVKKKVVATKKARPSTGKTTTATKKTVAQKPAAKKVVKKTVASKKANPKKPASKKTVTKKTTRPVAKRPASKKADTKKTKKSEKKSIFNRFKRFALPFAALVIIALLALAVTGNLGALFPSESSEIISEPSIIVETGDTVAVNYIGSFTDGEVFDTSYEQVAKDNELYKEGRPYTPLSFEVGAGQMIKGFDAAVVNMTIGETKTITLAPEDAYGPSDPAKIVAMPTSIDRIITLEREFVIARNDFTQVFSEDPVVGNIVSSDSFPWNFSVKKVSDSNVSLEYLIDVNDTIVLPQTIWNSTVTSKNDTTITIVQNPENGAGIETIFGTGIITLTEDKINIGFDVTVGETVTTPYGEGTIVNVTDDSVTLDLNSKMVGKTLVFEMTVVNITKADVGQSNMTIINSE